MSNKNTSDYNFNVPVSMACIAMVAIARAFLNEVFIYPNPFAPSGIAGIATMIQHMFNFKVGYFTLLVNVPLILLSRKYLSRKFALLTTEYVLVYSVTNIIFRSMDFTWIAFKAADGGDAILAAIAAGVCAGMDFTLANRLGGSTGGTDIVSAVVYKLNPEYDLTTIYFAINAVVAAISFFVYGRTYAPVILCIIYIFVNSQLSGKILRGAKAAVRFEIITNNPEALAHDLMTELKHGCSLIKSEGMYSHKENDILICIVNRHQVVDCQKIIERYPGSFACVIEANNIYGNFVKVK